MPFAPQYVVIITHLAHTCMGIYLWDICVTFLHDICLVLRLLFLFKSSVLRWLPSLPRVVISRRTRLSAPPAPSQAPAASDTVRFSTIAAELWHPPRAKTPRPTSLPPTLAYLTIRLSALASLIMCVVALDSPSRVNCEALHKSMHLSASIVAGCANLMLIFRTLGIWSYVRCVAIPVFIFHSALWGVVIYGTISTKAVWDMTTSSCTSYSSGRAMILLLFGCFWTSNLIVFALALLGLVRRYRCSQNEIHAGSNPSPHSRRKCKGKATSSTILNPSRRPLSLSPSRRDSEDLQSPISILKPETLDADDIQEIPPWPSRPPNTIQFERHTFPPSNHLRGMMARDLERERRQAHTRTSFSPTWDAVVEGLFQQGLVYFLFNIAGCTTSALLVILHLDPVLTLMFSIASVTIVAIAASRLFMKLTTNGLDFLVADDPSATSDPFDDIPSFVDRQIFLGRYGASHTPLRPAPVHPRRASRRMSVRSNFGSSVERRASTSRVPVDGRGPSRMSFEEKYNLDLNFCGEEDGDVVTDMQV